ncbi:MAG TPA: NAD(P)-dependent oxidoreductase [Polaromonas sp.]|uniref:NAD-dependent epimerase/dehydratase family protein n=1 Tax=Polaromonas sp. UBA4122 TaxID=1947074 RepID=UPI000ECEA38A|nr:NAD(P)-dependent oxidoreductase [Polaromonas sp. UBA4122]HAL39443.1 NAD(P)-dependent oxidoreductase [Polaromonas sp.]
MFNSKLRLLVTGGSGFIGTNVVDYFVGSSQHDVLNIDIAAPCHPGHKPCWRQIDLLDGPALQAAVSAFDPQFVLHLAARTDLDGKSLDDYAANTIGVSNLLEALKLAPSLRSVVFASSMLVCKLGYIPSSAFDYCPTTAYGESKVVGEMLVRANPPNCSWTLVRPTSIWGPWFKQPYRTFFDYVLKGRYFHIGKTRIRKTYGYVGNVVRQLEALILALPEQVDKKVFYLGDSSDYVIRDWADSIAHRKDIHIPEIPTILMKGGALLGDLLNRFGLRFPLTSFRLKNMTTENCLDLEPILGIVRDMPFDREHAIDLTLQWMNDHP